MVLFGISLSKQSVLLLVDYSNILYRAYYSSKMQMETKPWLPILRYIDMMRLAGQRVLSRYPGAQVEVIFAGESRKILKRTKLDKNYKSQRKPIEDLNFRLFRQLIVNVIEMCGWKIVSRDGAEADDVIASVASQYEGDIVIFSNDRDLRQLLCFPNVSIYQHPGIFYTPKMFLDDYGIDINDFVYYKALVGDKSDNIQGVYGWGPAKARKHILAQDWLQILTEEGQIDEYEASLQLVRLDFSLDCPVTGKKMRLNLSPNALEGLRKAYSDVCVVDEVQLGLKRLEEVLGL